MGVYKETHDCHHPLHYYSLFFSAFLSLEEGFYKSVEKITQKECNAHALHTKARDSSLFSSLALTHTRSNYLMYYCRCCCCYSFPPSFFCFFLSNPKWTWLLCAPFLLRWLKLQERRRTSPKKTAGPMDSSLPPGSAVYSSCSGLHFPIRRFSFHPWNDISWKWDWLALFKCAIAKEKW